MSQFVELVKSYTGQPELKTMNLSALGRGLGGDAAQTTIDIAYRYVPWFRRACKLRANAIGRFPLSLENDRGDDVSGLPEYQSVVKWTRSVLYRTEMNLVKYGAAYHLLESNRFGLNITPRFIPTQFVYPIIDYAKSGVSGFHVNMLGGGGNFPLDKMLWVWEPNDESEIQPGSSDGEAALKASGLLYAIEEMANRYMLSGGVPITAVRVPPTTSKDEREKAENWFQRFAGGFRNAFKFLVVDRNTEFETIGSELRQMEAEKLTGSERDNVAVAIGVPPTVLDGKSANYATADSEMTGFYMNTVVPESEFLEPALNVQLYQRVGLTLRFHPDELEVMQAIQLSQAQGVTELVGKPILNINEGRAIVEYEPIGPRGDWPKESEPAPTTTPAPQFGQPTPAASPASPAQLADATGGAVAEAQMRSWLSGSLDQLKAGQSPAIGTPFDSELLAASSGNAIRHIYESHWPRKSRAPTLNERAIAALENYNALAQLKLERSDGRNVHE